MHFERFKDFAEAQRYVSRGAPLYYHALLDPHAHHVAAHLVAKRGRAVGIRIAPASGHPFDPITADAGHLDRLRRPATPEEAQRHDDPRYDSPSRGLGEPGELAAHAYERLARKRHTEARPINRAADKIDAVAVGFGGLFLIGLGVAAAWAWPSSTPKTTLLKVAAGSGPAGGDLIDRRVDLGAAALRFPNSFDDATFLGISFPGLCGGMVATTLDYWTAGRPAPADTTTPSVDSALGAYVQERQVASLVGADGLTFLALLLNSDDAAVAERTGKEFDLLKAAIDRGTPVPLGLLPAPWTLVATDAHQVLAVGYGGGASGRTRVVEVWDPNHPRKRMLLTQEEADGAWAESDAATGRGTGDRWRGFFVKQYEAASPP